MRYRFTHGPAVCVGGDYIFNLRFPLIGAPPPCAAISVTLLRVPPRGGWRQWLVRLISMPAYGALALEDRTTLSDIQSDIAHLLKTDPVIEGVNSTLSPDVWRRCAATSHPAYTGKQPVLGG